MNVHFADYGIGLMRETVALVEHRPDWKECFQRVAEELRAAVPGVWLEVLHIGSTAIPTIQAKPILDILGVVASVNELNEHQGAFERIGLTWMGEFGIPGRRLLVAMDDARGLSLIHLHAFESGHPEVRRHLIFRDYLCAHPEHAREYSRLKQELQVKFPSDRAQYSAAKHEMIRDILQRAEAAYPPNPYPLLQLASLQVFPAGSNDD